MVATRELAEAQSWSRRRLAHVLVAGPDGVRGDEPPRPLRPVLGGALLAALLVGGFGVAGLVRGGDATPGATEPPALTVGVAVAAETGATYVVLDGGPESGPDGGLVARAVVNPTSARLLLPDGAGAAVPQTVPAAALAPLAARAPGPVVGIPTAPAAVPDATGLLTSPWVACPRTPGPVLSVVPERPGDPLGAGTALLVTAGGTTWLVVDAGDGARRYRLPPDPAVAETTLAALGAPPLATAVPVQTAWLTLVPPGTDPTLPPLAVRSDPTCLLLEPGSGGSPATAATAVVRLAAAPDAAVTPPGAGALVSTAERPRARWFVDDRGRALPVPGATARSRLGWAGAAPVVVPSAWLALLGTGPTLSVRAAATPLR